MMQTQDYYGKIKLTKGFLDVTDPCYDKDFGCQTTISNVKVGFWHTIVNTSEYGHVAKLIICHKKYLDKFNNGDLFFEDIASVGVDSGMAGFFEGKENYNDVDWRHLCQYHFRSKICGFAKKESRFGCVGVWSSTGYGDGLYGLYVAKNIEGEIVAAYIEFIEKENGEYVGMCSHCGAEIYDGDDYITDGGLIYCCQDCYDEDNEDEEDY